MAKGFKFPAPKGFAKGGMCSPKGAKGYAKGGYAEGGKMRSENTEYAKAVDRADRSIKYEYNRDENESPQDYRQRMARNTAKSRDIIPAGESQRRIGKETGYNYESAPDNDYGIERLSRAPYASGGKVAMKKMKSGRTFAKIKKGYADGGEVETEQTASKATRVKMPRGVKAPMARAKSVPVASRQPMIQPQAPAPAAAPLAMRGPAPSPLSRVANAAPRMGMKMGGKAKKC